MAEPIKISTGKYKTEGKIDIDGNIWSVKLLGAGSELRLSQAFRRSKLWGSRIDLIDKKIQEGKATEQDLDKYEEYDERYTKSEALLVELFSQFLSDGTPENASVKKWIDETPTPIIQMVFEDMQKQATQNNEAEASDGQQEPPASS